MDHTVRSRGKNQCLGRMLVQAGPCRGESSAIGRLNGAWVLRVEESGVLRKEVKLLPQHLALLSGPMWV